MTLQQFIKKFEAKMRREFTKTGKFPIVVKKNGLIRTRGSECLCPIEYVAGMQSSDTLGDAIDKLMLDYGVSDQIIPAADENDLTYYDSFVVEAREAMLAAIKAARTRR